MTLPRKCVDLIMSGVADMALLIFLSFLALLGASAGHAGSCPPEVGFETDEALEHYLVCKSCHIQAVK